MFKRIQRSRGEVYVSHHIAMHLAISLIRNFLLGLFLWLFIEQLRVSPAINMITSTTGHELPALLLMGSGVLGAVAWIRNKTVYARLGILIGAVMLMALVTSYFATLVEGTPQTGNWLVVLLASIVAHDFTLLGQPFIDPSRKSKSISDERVR